MTGTVPLEVTVTDFVTAVPTDTLPNGSEVALRVRADVAAFNCITTLCEEEFTLAETVAVCEVVTEATLALNDAVDAPEATDTLAGTVTALLLLNTFTLKPPDGAAELNERVHAVVPAPVKVWLPHESALIEVVGVVGVDADPLSVMDVAFDTDAREAVSVTVWVAVTADTFAAKLALAAPEATETEAGTVTALLLLMRLTVTP